MAWNQGFWFPFGYKPAFLGPATTVLDATGEYVSFVGRINIAGQATSKTIDTTASSAIYFSVGASPVFDNASSVFTVGFQGVDKTTGVPVRGNGTWAARSVITTAADTTPTLTTTADFHKAIPTAGTSTFSHGDEVCIVLEMTTKAGTDSVAPAHGASIGGGFQYPAGATNVSGSVVGTSSAAPAVFIQFSDGTWGWLDGGSASMGASSTLALTFSNATNPDENGLMFQVPFACSVDAVGFQMRFVDAASDFQFDFVSTPTSSQSSLISGPIAMTVENTVGAASEQNVLVSFPPVSLSAGVNYGVAVKATSTSNVRWNKIILPHADARVLLGPGGTTMQAITRDGGTGDYTAGSTTILNPLGVRISDFGGGGASVHRIP